jgi:hypothetical protein
MRPPRARPRHRPSGTLEPAPRRPRRRRAALAAAALTAFAAAAAPSCGQSFGPPSRIDVLRVITVTADPPFAAPGDTVTMRLTYADARGGPDGAEPIEVTWLGGCVDPANGDFLECIPALAPALAVIESGQSAPGLAAQEISPPENSGVPDAVSFDLAIPPDILAASAPPGAQALAYVFFAACAGTVRRTSVGPQGGFPLECIGEDGAELGGDSFVVGYTEVRVFADGRTNTNPPVTGLTLDGAPLGADPESAPVVPRCTRDDSEAQGGCGRRPQDPCTTYAIAAVVDDVAEEYIEYQIPGDPTLREAVWVNHFTDAGSFQGSTTLVSDPTKGYQTDHATDWTPPPEPALVTLWAVVHDNRGGVSVTRGFIRVE